MTSVTELLRVEPGSSARLADIDPRSTPGTKKGKVDAQAETTELGAELAELQEMLYANARHDDPRRVLLVLQGMDTSGKGGAVKRVAGQVNPAGVRIAGFGKPTKEELAHDFLWRIEKALPPAGTIGVFDRSHYEDVLIARVHELVPEDRWRRRYGHINDFERLLVEEGTTVVKFFLHISADEQRQRLQARLDDPTKRWKFRAGDLDERARWDDYVAAFEEAIAETSTDAAPWWVVPADRKWYRDLVVSSVLVQTLEGLAMQWPQPPDLTGITVT